MNGKGSKPRPVNRATWDSAEYWRRLEVRKAAKGGDRLTGGVDSGESGVDSGEREITA